MSRSLYIPEGYKSALTLRETQGSGINDDLNGVERKVDFDIKEIDCRAEVVQSLAKWKRMALYRYGYEPGEGIYTDMNAIRRDDDTDNTHSIFVDQWDWEKVITREQRNVEFLKEAVKSIVKAVSYTKRKVGLRYPAIAKRSSPRSTARYLSCRSAENSQAVRDTTAERPITTTGRSTVISSSGTKFSERAWKSPQWVSALTKIH